MQFLSDGARIQLTETNNSIAYTLNAYSPSK